MAINQEQAAKQFSRMEIFPGYPKADPLPWIRALRKASRSLDHCRATVDRLIERVGRDEAGYVRFPMPADVFHIAGTVADETQAAAIPPVPNCECLECCNSGWRTGFWVVTWAHRRKYSRRITEEQAAELRHKVQGLGAQEICEAAEICPCAHGARQKAIDAARQQIQAGKNEKRRGRMA